MKIFVEQIKTICHAATSLHVSLKKTVVLKWSHFPTKPCLRKPVYEGIAQLSGVAPEKRQEFMTPCTSLVLVVERQ